jgi:hypothetical protein
LSDWRRSKKFYKGNWKNRVVSRKVREENYSKCMGRLNWSKTFSYVGQKFD